jgi:hypothetical protein
MVDVSPGSAVSNFVATQRAQAQLSRSVSETQTERARANRQEFIRSGGGTEPRTAEVREYATPYNPPVTAEREGRVSDDEYNDRYFDRIADARSQEARQTDISNDLDQLAENNRLAGEAYQTGTQANQQIEAADQRRREARAEESRAQVQQQIDIRQSEERLAGAQNDPSQPRGSYVDIRA